MKALLLRVGIDTGTDKALAPIFEDGTFEYIPISEDDPSTIETRTYNNTIGRSGKPFSYFLPPSIKDRRLHFDPEFDTFTYGDSSSKRNFLLQLEKNDLLVFYAGLKPFRNKRQVKGLYIIGYFTVDEILDVNHVTYEQVEKIYGLYHNNAHLKGTLYLRNCVIIRGNVDKSKLLLTGKLISQPGHDRRGRNLLIVSEEMKELLGISGGIQRSIPPRFIRGRENIENLKQIIEY